MRLEYESSEQLKKDILRILAKYVNLEKYEVFFFGSRVTGHGDDRSDIDIGIKGPKPLNWDMLGKVQEELEELPILYKIDFIDFSQVSPKFKEVALQKIEPLW